MVTFILCLAFLASLVHGLPTSQQNFDGHKVLEILHNSEDDYKKVKDLELKYDLDFWKLPRHQNDSLYVKVSPTHIDDFLAELDKMNAHVSTFIDNVQSLLEEVDESSSSHRLKKRAVAARSSALDLQMYHSYNTILNHMNNVAMSRLLPSDVTVSVINIGFSYQGKPLNLTKVSRSGAGHAGTGHSGQKQAIFVDGGIHAREWIAPAVVLYFMEQLIYNPNNDPDVEHILNSFDVYLLPVVNPDGYEHSRTGINSRLWRKNRRYDRSGCYGVDLNRNFPFMWDPQVGGSSNPCSDVYSGQYGESEPETQALAVFLRHNGPHIAAYLTLHSYGQMWLYPWGYTTAYPRDSSDLHAAATAGLNALQSKYGTQYEIGSSTNVLYAAAGGSDDFAKGVAGIKYAYTLELRDTGRYGFLLPEHLILPTSQETFAGFVKFVLTQQMLEDAHQLHH